MGLWAQVLAILAAVVRLWSELYGTFRHKEIEADGARAEQGVAAAQAYKKLSDAIAARRRAERVLADAEQLRTADGDERAE